MVREHVNLCVHFMKQDPIQPSKHHQLLPQLTTQMRRSMKGVVAVM